MYEPDLSTDSSDEEGDGADMTAEQVCPEFREYAVYKQLLRDASIPAGVKQQATLEVTRAWSTAINDAYDSESVDLWKQVVSTNLAQLRRHQVVPPAATVVEILVAAKVCAALSKVGDDPRLRAQQFRSALKHTATFLPPDVSIASAAVTSHASTHVYALVATSEPTSTLYVAFRGTKNFADVSADLSFLLQLSTPNGRVHRGFAARAESLQGPALLALCRSERGLPGPRKPVKRVVLCGHSLGGAVASIAMLRTRLHLEISGAYVTSTSTIRGQSTSLQCDDVVCVTFGAPWWCDAQVRKAITTRGWTSGFLHFVDFADPVPKLMRLQATFDSLEADVGIVQQATEAIAAALGALDKKAELVVSAFQLVRKAIKGAKKVVKAVVSPYVPVGTFYDGTRDRVSTGGTRVMAAWQAMHSAKNVKLRADNAARHEMLRSYLPSVLATTEQGEWSYMQQCPLPAEVATGKGGMFVPKLKVEGRDASRQDEGAGPGVSGLLESILPRPGSEEAERGNLSLTFRGLNMMSAHIITIHNRTCVMSVDSVHCAYLVRLSRQAGRVMAGCTLQTPLLKAQRSRVSPTCISGLAGARHEYPRESQQHSALRWSSIPRSTALSKSSRA